MMISENYTPKKRQRRHVSKDELLKTADYIIAEWERETPGITANVDPAVLQRDILRFMRRCKIQTVEDYENSLVKLQAVL